MSITVFAIAAAHALPPIIGGVISNTKRGVWIGALIGSAIAVISGNPNFMLPDLIAVAAGTWFGLSVTR